MQNPFKSVYAVWANAGKPLLANPFKRKVTIIYKSTWLHGTYAFTFKPGQKGRILDDWMENFTAALPDSMTHADLKAARLNPQIEIIEVF